MQRYFGFKRENTSVSLDHKDKNLQPQTMDQWYDAFKNTKRNQQGKNDPVED